MLTRHAQRSEAPRRPRPRLGLHAPRRRYAARHQRDVTRPNTGCCWPEKADVEPKQQARSCLLPSSTHPRRRERVTSLSECAWARRAVPPPPPSRTTRRHGHASGRATTTAFAMRRCCDAPLEQQRLAQQSGCRCGTARLAHAREQRRLGCLACLCCSRRRACVRGREGGETYRLQPQ